MSRQEKVTAEGSVDNYVILAYKAEGAPGRVDSAASVAGRNLRLSNTQTAVVKE